MTITKNGITLKIIVKAGVKSNIATLSSNNIKSIPSTSIKIDSLGYSTTFGAVELSIDLDINQVRHDQQTGYDECDLIVLILKMVNAKFVVHEIVIKMMKIVTNNLFLNIMMELMKKFNYI